VKIFSVVARFFRPRGTSPRPRDRKVLLWVALAALLPAGVGVIRLSAQTEEATPSPSSEVSELEILNEVVVAEEAEAPSPASEPVSGAAPDPPPSPFSAPAETSAATPAESSSPAPAATVPPPTLAPPQDVEVRPAAPPVPTPPLRTSDVAFPTPAGAATNEPLVMIGRPVERANYGTSGNPRAAQLRSMPPETFTFDRASLRDVLRFLAEAAQIPYIGIPEHSPEAQKLVTFRMTASPFAALESVARQNDIKLTYEDGVWFMRLANPNLERARKAEDENELIGVIYQLRHDPGDRVSFDPSGGYGSLSGGAAMTGAGVTGGMQTGLSGLAGSGTSGLSSPQLPLQNSQYVFSSRAPKIVNDIRVMLGLKPLIYEEDGTVTDPDVVAGTTASQAPLPAFDGSLSLARGEESPAATPLLNTATPVYIPPQKPQVIYNADNNVIWVVATRKQQKWVAEYLQRVDQPQDLIAIEIKFLETKKNPQYDIGINWQNMLGSGITVRGSANAGIVGEYGFGFDRRRESGSTNTSSSGFDNSSSILNAISNAIINNQTNLTVTDIINNSSTSSSSSANESFDRSSRSSGNRRINLDFRGQNTTVPYEAVLSLDEVSVTLQAFMQDRDSSVVQYPRVLTINNREVAITSAENTPVNAGVQQTQSGSTATQTGTLGYLPIGTQINILPKVIGRNQIALTVAVTISSIIGTVPINLGTGFNEYPITTERVYNATLQVDSGYTLAVGGLEKVDDRDVQGGVPVLKDIPGLGYLFKNKNKARNRTNLIIFITPYVISDPARTPGISETPQSVLPVRPGQVPPAPTFTPDGQLAGGDRSIEDAFAWLEYQLRYFQQVNQENLISLDSIEKLRGVISVARVFLADLQLQAGTPPYDEVTTQGRRVARAETLLTDLNRTLAASQDNLM